MEKPSKSSGRNGEIVTFFYIILSHRVREGMAPEKARQDAYDAVALRYDISRGRLLNIISENRNSQIVNETGLRRKAVELIGELEIVNKGYDAAKSKNEKLISLLKECLEDER